MKTIPLPIGDHTATSDLAGIDEFDRTSRWYAAFRLLLALSLGLAAAFAAIALNELQTRYLGAMLVALGGIVALPLLGGRQRAFNAAVIVMTAGLSVGFSISFLHRMLVPGKFVAFMGEAEGVTVSLTLVAVALYLSLWMFERYFYGIVRPLRIYQPLFWPAVLFMIAGMLSLYNAADLPLVALEEFRLLCLLAVTVVTMNLRPRELNLLLLALAASVIVQATLASMQFATGRSFGLSIFGEATLELARVDFQLVARPTGLFGDPNIMAYFFEITLPLMLALGLVTQDKLERWFYLLAAAAGLTGTFVSLSRAAWATVPVTVGFILLKLYGRKLLRLSSALIGIAVLAATAAASVAIYPIIARRLLGDDAGSTSWRKPLAVAAWNIIQQFPWFGVGLNNFAITFSTYDTTGYSYVRPDIDYVVHNLHLLVWTEVGTVGFVAFLWYFFSVFVETVRMPRSDIRGRAIAMGISAGLFAHLMHGMVDPGFKLNLTISQLIAVLIGVVGCLALAARSRPAGVRPLLNLS